MKKTRSTFRTPLYWQVLLACFCLAFGVVVLAVSYQAVTASTEQRSRAAEILPVRTWNFTDNQEGWVVQGGIASVEEGRLTVQMSPESKSVHLVQSDPYTALDRQEGLSLRVRLAVSKIQPPVLGAQDETTSVIPNPPTWLRLVPPNLRNFVEMLYLWVVVYKRPTNMESLLDGVREQSVENIMPTCRPRPACLDDATPCEIAQTSDMCPPRSAERLYLRLIGSERATAAIHGIPLDGMMYEYRFPLSQNSNTIDIEVFRSDDMPAGSAAVLHVDAILVDRREVGIPSPTVRPSPSSTPDGCVVGGCSGELCVSAAANRDIASICLYKEEYACYKGATCEKQADGVCGWTQTEKLQACLTKTGVTQTPKPTPPPGCHYQEVVCIQAPCNPILVCETETQ